MEATQLCSDLILTVLLSNGISLTGYKAMPDSNRIICSICIAIFVNLNHTPESVANFTLYDFVNLESAGEWNLPDLHIKLLALFVKKIRPLWLVTENVVTRRVVRFGENFLVCSSRFFVDEFGNSGDDMITRQLMLDVLNTTCHLQSNR
jgi:hypothetical protein